LHFSCCPEHSWYRRPRKKINKKSIFFPSDPSQTKRKGQKSGTSESSSSSINSSNKKKYHRRKRKRRAARSKSHKRSISAKPTSENDPQPILSQVDVPSISDPEKDDEQENEDDDDDDRTIALLDEQMTALNCEDDDDQSDDSDSMDEAIDAECFEEDVGNTSIMAETNSNI